MRKREQNEHIDVEDKYINSNGIKLAKNSLTN